MINLYCDESCHLPNDSIPLMVIGGVSCPASKATLINAQIREIKKQHNVYEFAEMKWNKVSKSKVELFIDLVDVFFDNTFLTFRGVVAKDKDKLEYNKFQLTHDDWYQRIYYLVLKEMIQVGQKYSVYVDIKDTKGAEKTKKLKEVLNNALYSFYEETVEKIQLVRSDQIQILQLTDIFIGALSYINRDLKSNDAKINVINHIQKRANRSLVMSSPKSEDKFNVFIWNARK